MRSGPVVSKWNYPSDGSLVSDNYQSETMSTETLGKDCKMGRTMGWKHGLIYNPSILSLHSSSVIVYCYS